MSEVNVSSGSSLKRNIAANVLGGVWSVGLTFIAIPVQLKVIGPEVYGLLGFIASLQGLFSVLDFGLSTTIIRELAGDSSLDRQTSRDLIKTASTIYWTVALLLGLGAAFSAPWLVTNWIKLEGSNLSVADAVFAIQIMALSITFSWPVSLYTSALTGAQRLDLVNVLRVASSTVSTGGATLVLLLSHNLYFFLLWMAGSAIFTILLHVVSTFRFVNYLSPKFGFSLPIVKRVAQFSFDVNIISILGIVYTQTDRILIGRLLPLSQLGYYVTAYNLSRGVSTVQGFVNAAMLPSLAADYSLAEREVLLVRYNKYVQILVYIVALPTYLLLFFGYDFLTVWATPQVAERAASTLGILAIGFLLNAAMSAPYTLSIASGYTRLPVLVNLVGLIFYLPGLYLLTATWGIEGAALGWVALNLYYLASFLPLTQKRLLGEGFLPWLTKNLFPFLSLGGLFWLGRQIVLQWGLSGSPSGWAVCGLASMTYVILGYFLLAPSIRQAFRYTLQSGFATLKVHLYK